MSRKSRNLLIIAAVLALSVVVWSVAAAQEATGTPQPSPSIIAVTPEATAQATTQAHAFLGVALEDNNGGVTVAQVVSGSAAASAGLQVGDMITAINGTAISSAADAANVVAALKPGDQVTIAFTRNGSSMSASATLGTQSATTAVQPFNRPQPGQQGQPPQPGQQGQPRPFAFGNGFGIQYNSSDQSWTINSLPTSSPLYSDGLHQGDVIKTFDGSLYDPQSLIKYLSTLAQNATVTLSVERNGATQDIQVSLSDLRGLAGVGFAQGNSSTAFGAMSPLLQMIANSGHLGITYETIDAQVAQQNNLTVTEGALVTAVDSGSAADKAGLKVNDVITAVAADNIDAKHPLPYLLLPYQPGDTVALTVLRDGASQQIQATLDAQTATMGGLSQMFPFAGRLPFGMGRGGSPFGQGNNGQGGFGFRGGQGQQNQPQATPQAVPNA